jgi:uncharacterized damage-inducible protein DinB
MEVAQARGALANTTDEHLMAPWRFLLGGRAVNQRPRHSMLSDAVLSHLAHHRGQLTIYLRLTGSTAPWKMRASICPQFKTRIGFGRLRRGSNA